MTAAFDPADAGRDLPDDGWARTTARRPSLCIADELHHRHLQCGGETADVVQAHISTPKLDLGDVRAMELCTLGECFLGQAATRSKCPDRSSEGSEERV